MKPIHYFGSILSTLLLTLKAVHADSLSFTDKWQDSVQNSVVVSQDTGTFSATLNVPGLGSVSTTALEGTTASITFGDIQFSDIFANADSKSASSATFLQTELDNQGNTVTVGSITFSRSGNLLIISGRVQNPITPVASMPFPIIADFYTNTVGPIEDQQFVEVSLAGALNYDFQNYVNISGTSSVTQDTHGNNLDLVQVTGSVDLTPPTLTSISPLTGAQLVNGLVTVTNRATDNVGVSSVEFYLNGQDFGPGTLGAANNWTLNLALPAGLNSIKTVASDTSSNSTTNTVQVTYTNTKTNANLIAYSEKWLDTTYTNFDGSVPSVANISQDTGFLNAALKVPGLQAMSAATWSNLVLAVNFGNLVLNNTFSTADILTTNKAVFFYNTQSDGSGNPVVVGQLTVSRAGNNLIMEARTGNPSYISPDTSDSLLADYYYGTNGPIQDQQICAINLQDGSALTTYLNLSQVVYISGSDITNVDGSGTELDNLQVSGAADFTAPTNQIVAPVSGIRVSNNQIVVTGIARDNIGVTNVLVSLNGGDWLPTDTGNGWTNWLAGLTNLLEPGTNVVAAYAVDPSGNASVTNQVKFEYVLSALLTVGTNGQGSIAPAYNNTLLQISNNYSMTATAKPGYAFTNWTDGVGNVVTNRATLQFVMGSNLTFVANFNDTNWPTLSITNPMAGGRVSNNVVVVSGKAWDNVGVVAVNYNLNGTGWTPATLVNNGSNWVAGLTNLLVPGTNVVAAYAVDPSGNASVTNQVKFEYVLSALLTVGTNGQGSIAPAYNNTLLQISNNYSMTATAKPGYAFTNWTDGVGNVVTNRATLQFVMGSNLTFVANFNDTNWPTLSITNPMAGGRVSNNVVVVSGKAWDNVGVVAVNYNLNGTGWTPATLVNNGSNWVAGLTNLLVPGTNVVAAYAVDPSGNASVTNQVKFEYVLSALLTVGTNGQGSIAPAYNNTLLQISNNYSMTATAKPGYAFTNWTDGVGNVVTNRATLQFVMGSNLTFVANFNDTNWPTLSITNPMAGGRVSNNVVVVSGKAWDNVGVVAVNYNLNGTGWTPATLVNNGSNWVAGLTNLLVPGTNVVAAYAVDPSGNASVTNQVKFEYVLSALLTVGTNGQGSIAPAYNNTLLQISNNYSMTATAKPGYAFTNWTDGVGNVVTNRATLQFVMGSNLTFVANFNDTNWPTLSITNPMAGGRVSNNVVVVSGKAWDNVGVVAVNYNLNGTGWTPATLVNNGSNWVAGLTNLLVPGTNVVAAYAVDPSGNASVTNQVKFEYVLSALLTVGTNGQGSIAPAYNNTLLQISNNYSMTATAKPGYAFTNWTDGVGNVVTNRATLQFVMGSNLTFVANFNDTNWPTLSITNPMAGGRVSNNVVVVSGKAWDNVGVVAVNYNLNGTGWTPATLVNNGSNWVAGLTNLLVPGTNVVAAYAVDPSGNASVTNQVKFLFIPPPSLVGTWNLVQFQTPAQITFDVNNGLLGGGNFAVTNGAMTINDDGSLSGHLGSDFTGTYTTGSDGTVTANLTTPDGTELHTFYVNADKDTLVTADSLYDANDNQQEIIVAHRQPATVVAADVTGAWNLVQFKTPALITNDINSSLQGGDSFATTNGSLTLNANGTFSGHLNNAITGTYGIGSDGIINLLTSSGTHTFYINASKDTMTLVDSMYDPGDNYQEMVVAQRVPVSVALADLAGTWNLTQFQTPAAITNDVSNGVQGGGNFEVLNGSLTVSANGTVSGSLGNAFTGTLTIGASGAITLHITSNGSETHTFYVNAGKNTLILTDSQFNANNNQQETVVAQRVPAN